MSASLTGDRSLLLEQVVLEGRADDYSLSDANKFLRDVSDPFDGSDGLSLDEASLLLPEALELDVKLLPAFPAPRPCYPCLCEARLEAS